MHTTEKSFTDSDPQVPDITRLRADIASGGCGHIIIVQPQDMRSVRLVYGREAAVKLLALIHNYITWMGAENGALYMAGKDSFVFSVKGAGREAHMRIAEEIFGRFRGVWVIPNGAGRIVIKTAASVCLVPTRGEGGSRYNLRRAACFALDAAQKSGRVAVYDSEMSRSLRRRTDIEAGLQSSARAGMTGFSVEYQPVIEAGTGTWGGLEALCRWECPGLGAVPPGEFIPVAEAGGLVEAIDYWVLEQAMAHVKTWNLGRVSRFMLFVNMSHSQLLTADVVGAVSRLLKKYDFPPEKLCVEFTRPAIPGFPMHSNAVYESLGALGISTAIDDFGTDSASINHIHKQKADVLKIHSSLIDGLESEAHMRYLVHYMLSLAHESGKKGVAKGVESCSQANILLNQGVDYLQGYYFARGMPPEQIRKGLFNFYIPTEDMRSLLYGRPDMAAPRGGLPDYSKGILKPCVRREASRQRPRSVLTERGHGLKKPLLCDLSPSYSRLLNKCMLEMFSTSEGDASINTALEIIGKGLGVSRAYVFLRGECGLAYSNTHEWCAGGVASKMEQLRRVLPGDGHGEWFAALAREGFIISPDIRGLEAETFKTLDGHGVRAAAVFAVFKNGELHGFVGFDDCAGTRAWSRDEIQMLHALTDIITSTIAKMSQRRELEAVASTDMLTRILNRTAITGAIKRMLKAAAGDGKPVTVAFIDIDCLKFVNDTYGHQSGDRLITYVTETLRSNIRKSDIIGRYGGDEFLMAFYGCPKALADERLRGFLAGMLDRSSSPWSPSFSYGLAESSELEHAAHMTDDEYFEALIDMADKRMLRQKKRNRYAGRGMESRPRP